MSEYAVAVEAAMERLDVIPDYDAGAGPGPCVHTFMQSGIGLLGAHWYLHDVRASFERWGVEESGTQAKGTGHGLVVVEEHKGKRLPVFFATREQAA